MKTMLHMHQIRNFIDDRHSFYNEMFNNKEPNFYRFKGMKNAFTVGSAVDFGIKTYYLNRNQEKYDGIYDSSEFKSLKRIDQILCVGLLGLYIDYYSENEHFHSFGIENHKIPFGNFVIYTSPDLTALTYHENRPVIIEIKTSGEDEAKYMAETLDFQTMTYVWSYFYEHGVVPYGVLKRTLMKPKIRIKKNETPKEFELRLLENIAGEEKYLKRSFRPITLDMILEYELYLNEVLIDMERSLSGNKYMFYKNGGEYWG